MSAPLCVNRLAFPPFTVMRIMLMNSIAPQLLPECKDSCEYLIDVSSHKIYQT